MMRKSSSKRDLEEPGKHGGGMEMPLQKKRFVWPERIHNDFVAAVFDAGLKHLMEGESEYMWGSINGAHEKASPEQIKRHVLKILSYRINEKKERMLKDKARANIKVGADGDGGTNDGQGRKSRGKGALNMQEIPVGPPAEESRPSVRLEPTHAELAEVYKHLEDAKRVVQLEKAFKSQLEAKIDKHNKLFKKLSEVISTLDSFKQGSAATAWSSSSSSSSAAAALRMGNQSNSSSAVSLHLGDDGDYTSRRGTSKAGSRPASAMTSPQNPVDPVLEGQVMKEFTENMLVHRRLLQQKEDQLSQYGSYSDLTTSQEHLPLSRFAVQPQPQPPNIGGLHFHNGAVIGKGEGGMTAADDTSFPLRERAGSREYSLSLSAPVLVRSPSGLSTAQSDTDPALVQQPPPQPPGPGPGAGTDPDNPPMDFEELDVDRLFGFLLD